MSDDRDAEIEPEKTEAKHHEKDAPGWIAGGVLLMMGLLLLVSNLTGAPFNNWWALFILIPALGSLYTGLKHYSEAGAFTEAARKPITGGLILLMISVIFLFNLDWSTLWPFFLIVAGGMMLVTAIWPR